MDSRLTTSGMTEGGVKPSGMTGGPALAPLSCPPHHCPAHRSAVLPAAPLSCPPPPLSCPPLLCPAHRSAVLPAIPPLSFPQCLAGIQCLSLLSLHSCGPHGNSHGFPINNVGNDRRRSKTVGHDRRACSGSSVLPAEALSQAHRPPSCPARRLPSCPARRPSVLPTAPPSFPPAPPLSFPQCLAGIQRKNPSPRPPGHGPSPLRCGYGKAPGFPLIRSGRRARFFPSRLREPQGMRFAQNGSRAASHAASSTFWHVCPE